MVSFRRLGFVCAFIALTLVVACGGGSSDDSNPSSASGQTTATRAPARSGPTALLDPTNGPPGTEITVTGAGWPARSTIEVLGDVSPAGAPYVTATANEDGTFTAKFRLERLPSGSELRTGRFNLIAHSGGTNIPLSFNVESRRPIDSIPGGGGG